MEPVTITITSTLLCATAFKCLERYLGRERSIAISAPDAGQDYDRRFEDPEYVKMIHATRKLEIETLGYTDTPCECANCKAVQVPAPKPKPPSGPAGVSYAAPRRRREVVAGYVYVLPDTIPDTWKAVPRPINYGNPTDIAFANFSWYDGATGKQYTMVLSSTTRADSYEIRTGSGKVVKEGYISLYENGIISKEEVRQRLDASNRSNHINY